MPLAPETVLGVPFATRLGVFLVAGFVFIILGLAASHFFRRPLAGQSLAFRLHEGAGFFFAIVHLGALLMLPDLSVGPMLAGAALYAAGLALFLWVQETIKKQPPFLPFSGVHPETLFVSGPFGVVRHPCYVAFSLVWAAGVVATLNPWIAASAALMIASYIVAARDEEQSFLRTRLASEFRGYRARTGMFVPSFSTASQQTLLAVLVAVLAALGLMAILVFDLVTTLEAP